MKKVLLSAVLAAVMLISGCSKRSATGQEHTSNDVSPMPSTYGDTTESAETESEPIIETGVTQLYTDVFKPLYKGMSTMTFDEGLKIVDSIDNNKFSVEVTYPTDEVSPKIIITDNDGDVLTVYFYYDFRREDEKDTLSIMEYKHGEYGFSASDTAHIAEVSYEIYDPEKDPSFYKAESLSDCEKFLFGSSEIKEQSYEVKLLHGELLEKSAIGTSLTIKAKIEPSYNNKATIDQNYFNIENIIKNQGGTRFTQIDYWAVADMTDGSEKKVISFTLSEDIINKIANNQIAANTLGNYVDDLYILPSLQE